MGVNLIPFLLAGLLVGAAAGVGVGFIVWDGSGYDDGYGDGAKDGYTDGYTDGGKATNTTSPAYLKGKEVGDAEGYDRGYDKGYDDGFDTDAYESGFDDGYDDGVADATRKSSVKFLIQDGDGVWFWVAGSGITVRDAFEDASEVYDIPFTLGSNSNILTLYGIAASGGDSWIMLFWDETDEEWCAAGTTMKNTKAADQEFVCLIYAGDTYDVVCGADDAVVLDVDVEQYDIKFLIQSPSGMYFKIGADEDYAETALAAAFEKYGFDCEMSWGWITYLFNEDLVTIPVGDDWAYWVQFTYNSSPPAGWEMTKTGLDGITASELDGAYIGISFGLYGIPPSVSPYGEKSFSIIWDDLGNDFMWETTIEASGAEVFGKVSVIDGNDFSFTVNTTKENLSDTELTVEYSFDGGLTYTILLPYDDVGGLLYYYKIECVTCDVHISVKYTGNVDKVFDVNVTPPWDDYNPAPSYLLNTGAGIGYSIGQVAYSNNAWWEDADDSDVKFTGKFVKDDEYILYVQLVTGYLSFTADTSYDVSVGIDNEPGYQDSGIIFDPDSGKILLWYKFVCVDAP
ncbi:MAG: hypothetical protein FWD37_04935 [Methanomassiliicoccaceae archaeon]|nr:hypothetical protein [Methanomassiliicoccaceae archaeon]